MGERRDRAEQIAGYMAAGHWGRRPLADFVAEWAAAKPEGVAFASGDHHITWAAYDALSDRLAACLVDHGLERGDRLATLLPDGPEPHVAWLAAEKTGLVSVGIGSRAGPQEIRRLVERSEARALLVAAGHALGAAALPGGVAHLEYETLVGRGPVERDLVGPGLDPSELWMLNSTSGTTGMPKLVMHAQNRWYYFHQVAAAAGELTREDVFCSAIPSPFGFGLWTAHFTPTYLGAPTHVMRRFSADGLIELLASEQITVLAAVTTQVLMMLNSPALARAAGDGRLDALRVVFTGGEAVPYEQMVAFEAMTGATVLQFYGSNETGAASCTTTHDDQRRRLTTAGRVIEAMQVRLFGEGAGGGGYGAGRTSGTGQPGCRGPAMCEGYYDDDDANEQLYTPDGWMLMGDLVEIDQDGYLTVVGRTSDIIIRGGKNISAPAVEAEVMTHPDVSVAAALAVPDRVFGEKVAVYIEGPRAVTLDGLRAHLDHRGVTREWFPEYLVQMEELPRSSGGKVAKGALKEDVRVRFGDGQR